MNKKHILTLSIGMILILACSISTGQPSLQPPMEQPTYTAFPTYTPLPTYTVEAPPVVISTQAIQATATVLSSPNPPKFNANLLKPNLAYGGNTKYGSEMLYFEGQAGQLISLVLTGESHYQEFSLRDSDNKGLVGCEVKGIRYCEIDKYKLPYGGLFYVLVDRTLIDNYKKYQSCVNNPPYPDWCYRGGPYSIMLTIQ